jgi:hypothetical protein
MNSTIGKKVSGQADSRKEPAEGFIHSSDGLLHYLDWGGTGLQAMDFVPAPMRPLFPIFQISFIFLPATFAVTGTRST